MRVAQMENGVTVIDCDEDVVSLAAGVDMEAPYWEYTVKERVEGVRATDKVTEIDVPVRVDVSSLEPSLGVLGNLYRKAQASKRPEDAAGYVRHKERVLAFFHKRDVLGERYER